MSFGGCLRIQKPATEITNVGDGLAQSGGNFVVVSLEVDGVVAVDAFVPSPARIFPAKALATRPCA
jgi:hypothetical protein